jgi:ADP-ribose pyrophosphatase YjhB (NUDIX family)
MSLWFKGINPVVDLVVVRTHPENGLQVLLAQRGPNDLAEASKWALPGGFQDTNAKKDQAWADGTIKEIPLDAALRECEEETLLKVDQLKSHVKAVGVYTGPGRDPRETEERFTQSHAFFLSLDGLVPLNKSEAVFGADGMSSAKWVAWRELSQMSLAFDHANILADAEKHLSVSWQSLPKKPKP